MNTNTIYIYIAHHGIGITLIFENCDKLYHDIFDTLVSRLLQKPLFRVVCSASDCYVDTEPRSQSCCNLMIALAVDTAQVSLCS